VHQLDFNTLPRVSRERFIRALQAPPPVGPICSRLATHVPSIVWYATIALALTALVGLGAIGFGGIATPVQDRRYLVGYVVACGLLGLAAAMLARQRASQKTLPFPAGVYVLTRDLVDARSREIELYPLAEVVSIDPVHHRSNGGYSHTILWLVFQAASFSFEVRGRQQAEALRAQIGSARHSAERGAAADPMLDPFSEARARRFEPVEEPGLLAEPLPIWANFVWAIAIVAGLVLGVAGWRGRNAASDAIAFKAVSAKPEPEAVLLYMSAGGLRVDKLKTSVLPRARFAAAKKETGATRVEALDRFLKDYPLSEIDAEARAALAEALHVEFASYKTVAELRAFVTRWPNAADAPVGKAKIHDLYQSTLADFRQHANVTDKNVAPVVEALLAWEDERGARGDPVDVRFRRKRMSTLEPTDKLLAKGVLDDDGPAKSGNADLARWFAPEQLADRESGFVRGLDRALRAVFPADLVPLRIGAAIDDDDTPLERPEGKKGRSAEAPRPPARLGFDVTQPTMIVDYEVGWNGLTYTARDRKRRFLGIFLKCDVTLAVPNPTRTLAFTLKLDTPESMVVDPPKTPDDDKVVYDTMIARAFDRAPAKLAAVFFDPQTAASRVAEPL
jgi:hypothetical protein